MFKLWSVELIVISFMNDETSKRLERVEANMAHLEHQVEQLNSVIIAQGKLVEQMRKQVQRQSTTLESIELDRIKATNTKPPHYQ
jgi:uncharacterized coiled-coil protein SlyX